MAKTFFYVCAGLLMLALSYHFGAAVATAQNTTAGFHAAVLRGRGAMAVYPNGDVYYFDVFWRSAGNIFGGNSGGRTIVQLDGGETAPVAGASSGEIFYGSNYPTGGWENFGVPPAGVTGVNISSWGAVKTGARNSSRP